MSHSVLMDGGRPGLRFSVVLRVVLCNYVCMLGGGGRAEGLPLSRDASQPPV